MKFQFTSGTLGFENTPSKTPNTSTGQRAGALGPESWTEEFYSARLACTRNLNPKQAPSHGGMQLPVPRENPKAKCSGVKPPQRPEPRRRSKLETSAEAQLHSLQVLLDAALHLYPDGTLRSSRKPPSKRSQPCLRDLLCAMSITTYKDPFHARKVPPVAHEALSYPSEGLTHDLPCHGRPNPGLWRQRWSPVQVLTFQSW